MSKYSRVIDLTVPIHSDMILWKTYPKPTILPWSKYEISGTNSEVIFFSDHTGTHIDAPYHKDNKGKKIDDFPVGKFVSNAVLLDFTHKRAEEYITAEDIMKAEEACGKIQEGDAVLFYTGWDKHMDKQSSTYDNPGLSKDGVEYLVTKKVSIVGIDADSVDNPLEEKEGRAPAHKAFLPRDILIVERLCNLGKLKKRRFKFVALPLNLRGASGSPIRAVAIEE
jgi:kynurenine formamidase